jgi:hypothetical protein
MFLGQYAYNPTPLAPCPPGQIRMNNSSQCTTPISIGPSFAPAPPIPTPTQAVGPTTSAMGIPPAITAAAIPQGTIATGPVLPMPDVAAPAIPTASAAGGSTDGSMLIWIALAVGAAFMLAD